ncbi:hypothetical protein ACFLR4_00930 [Bacteroidota bacterium]
MNAKKYLSIILLLLAVACSENESLNSPYENVDFLGAAGTNRSYVETEIWLKSDSDLPYFTIPSELSNQISLSREQLAGGVCIIRNILTEVNSITEQLYNNWDLSLAIENYLQITISGEEYSLKEEIEALWNGANYNQSDYSREKEVYIRDEFGIRSVYPPQAADRQDVTSYIMNNIVVGDTWTREKIYETGTSNIISETVAEVLGIETVTVPAGTFSAYKIKLTTNETGVNVWNDGYEYFVPDVGLVLQESDRFYAWDDPETGERKVARKICMKVLESYDFKSD